MNTDLKPGEKPLNNQQAREIAGEIVSEFHPTGVLKIIGNLTRMLRRVDKQSRTEFQIKQAEKNEQK